MKSLVGGAAETVLLLENISSSILVGPDQLPSLHASMLEAAAILGVDTPELYVRQVSCFMWCGQYTARGEAAMVMSMVMCRH